MHNPLDICNYIWQSAGGLCYLNSMPYDGMDASMRVFRAIIEPYSQSDYEIPQGSTKVREAIKAIRSQAADANVLMLSTIHQAKGREWQNVILAGVSHNLLPHRLATKEEESLLLYVAFTRASKNLVIASTSMINPDEESPGCKVYKMPTTEPSEFLSDLGLLQ
jgi:superfamily I DNA/RNA helicase